MLASPRVGHAPNRHGTRIDRVSKEDERVHINVNAVAPGFIEAVGYYGQPEDVARAHLYLASPDADCISGIILPAAGAMFGGG